MMDFTVFSRAVAANFKAMTGARAFRVGVSGDDLWAAYLSSFPEGSNLIHQTRTHHDCSCCKQFIRAVGNVVSVDSSGNLRSIWNVTLPGQPEYQAVADALDSLVTNAGIASTFWTSESAAGTAKTFQQIADGVKTWDHFFVNIPDNRRAHAPATVMGNDASTVAVFQRGCESITDDALDTVLELIAQGTLYRGNENKKTIEQFKKARDVVNNAPADLRGNVSWRQAFDIPPATAAIRNTAVGTILNDLSDGMDIENAVRRYESVYAPTNYRRPTARVTPAMVKKAREKVEELGLTSALSRRFASLSDVSINDVIYADRSAKSVMVDSGDPFAAVEAAASRTPKNFDKVETVPLAKFIDDILPTAQSVEVLFSPDQTGNLVSLIAPTDPTAQRLFTWGNAFSWSYAGDVADSIKERVKAAGGNVTGDVCCRLAWSNYDDLDFHLTTPNNEVYFGNRRNCNAFLDVDMNAGGRDTRQPVENIVIPNLKSASDGKYVLSVNQYHKRETIDTGFTVEIDVKGKVYSFNHPTSLRGRLPIATIMISGGEVVSFTPHTSKHLHVGAPPGVEKWGIKSGEFHRVSAIMKSPNHWGQEQSGNCHYFFMIAGCVNDESARGFYNEFLRGDLKEHRKVLEMVGSRTMVESTPDQLSGFGFSDTQRATITVRVTGKATKRVIKVAV